MRPNILIRLFLLSFVLGCLNMGCKRGCGECYGVNTHVGVENNASAFRQIKNLENNLIVWETDYYGDSIFIDIPLDPSRPKSSFIFSYESKPPDTLVIAHQFEEAYSEECEDYYFDKAAASLEKNTFGDDLILHNKDKCLEIDIILR